MPAMAATCVSFSLRSTTAMKHSSGHGRPCEPPHLRPRNDQGHDFVGPPEVRICRGGKPAIAMTVVQRSPRCQFTAHSAGALYLVNPHDPPAGYGLQFTDFGSNQLFLRTGIRSGSMSRPSRSRGCQLGLSSRQGLPQGQGLPNTNLLPFRQFDLADYCVSHVARLNQK